MRISAPQRHGPLMTHLRDPKLVASLGRLYAPANALIDLACLGGLLSLAYRLRTDSQIFSLDHAATLALPCAATLLALYIVGSYSIRRDLRGAAYFVEHLIAVAVALLLITIFAYVVGLRESQLGSSRLALSSAFLAFGLASVTYRRWSYRWLIALLQNRFLMLIGSPALAAPLIADLDAAREFRQVVVVDPAAVPPDELLDHDFEACDGVVILQGQSGDAIAGRLDDRMRAFAIALQMRSIPVYFPHQFYEWHLNRVRLDLPDQTWLLGQSLNLDHHVVWVKAKRLIDMAVAAAGLALLAPLFAAVAAAILVDSGRPVLFLQRRIGRFLQPFTMVKFRTMVPGAEAMGHYTRRNDPRVTRTGRFLRAARIDELPQLWNVLIGHMSLIGPRAEWDDLVGGYLRQVPYYELRHLVRPGITGFAQIMYPYGESVEDAWRKAEYDLYYLRHYSLLIDLKIAVKTVYTVLRGGGQ